MSSNSSPVKTRPTPWDGLVVAAVVLLGVLVAVFFYGPKTNTDGPLTCVVSVGGQVVDSAPLASFAGEHTYSHNGYTLTIQVSGGQVEVLHSDCPGQDCVHSGSISRAGQSLICLPAQVVIHLESGTGGPDVIVG
ncbi:MAG: NusG domain II-containing protein [Oscillospiraceae bacterium]|nr:NusG domain II-containing protein [Oscillospiraceae bacterium]